MKTHMITAPKTSIRDYTKPLLNQKQIRVVPAHFQNEEWFVSEYQARVHNKSPEFYTLRTLLGAVKNSEEQFQQYPVDDRNMKQIARSIFIEEQWLMRDIILAFYQNNPYIIGGRHRVTAIANVFAEYIRTNYSHEQEQEEMFQLALEQYVRCEVLHLQTLHDLLALVQADNQSRTMRKAEQAHLNLQTLGADAHSVDAVGKTVLGSELDAKDAVNLAAQHFVRQTDSKLKAQTRQVLGEKLARYVLYGTLDAKLYKHTPLKVESSAEFGKKMDRAWEIVKELTQNEIVVAKYSSEIAQKVMDRLKAEYPETESAPEEATETPHVHIEDNKMVVEIDGNVDKDQIENIQAAIQQQLEIQESDSPKTTRKSRKRTTTDS